MSVIQDQLPDELRSIVDRQIAAGRVASESEFMIEAARRFADDLAAEEEIAGLVERADADIAAGRYVMVSTPEDKALHDAAMARLREGLGGNRTGS